MKSLKPLILAISLVVVAFASSPSYPALAQDSQALDADEANGVSISHGASPNATCTSYPVYTTSLYRDGRWKPTIYIWGLPGGGDEGSTRGIGIYYQDPQFGWEQVPASSDWGVRLIPQDRREKWTGYFIATRWYTWHWNWDDDWRWRVYICR